MHAWIMSLWELNGFHTNKHQESNSAISAAFVSLLFSQQAAYFCSGISHRRSCNCVGKHHLSDYKCAVELNVEMFWVSKLGEVYEDLEAYRKLIKSLNNPEKV